VHHLFASGGVTEEDVQTRVSGINVYPNPANHTAVVRFNSSKVSDYKLELTDVSGKVLLNKTGKMLTGENKIKVDVSKYAPGIYMINLMDGEHGRRMVKMQKE